MPQPGTPRWDKRAKLRLLLTALAVGASLISVEFTAQITHIIGLVKLGVADVWPTRNYNLEKPCSDDLFLRYRKLYAYDKTPLNPRVESAEDTGGYRRERISLDAAYRGERLIVDLYLPTHAKPPLQTVVHFPGSYAF